MLCVSVCVSETSGHGDCVHYNHVTLFSLRALLSSAQASDSERQFSGTEGEWGEDRSGERYLKAYIAAGTLGTRREKEREGGAKASPSRPE